MTPFNSSETYPDQDLLGRWFERREAEAFNEIVSRYAGLVYGVGMRVLRNANDAEDITQECFLKLAKGEQVPQKSLAGWLHTVANHLALDLLRSKSRRRAREQKYSESFDKDSQTRETNEWENIQNQVDLCIAELPEDERHLIVSHFLGRKTHKEIAKELGVSRQTVTYRLQQSIEKLRKVLAKKGYVASVTALTLGLSQTASAAPPAVLSTLGKLALFGPASTTSTTLTATQPLVILGSIAMTKKLTISLIAAIILCTGSWIILFNLETPPSELSQAASNSDSSDPSQGLEISSPEIQTQPISSVPESTIPKSQNNSGPPVLTGTVYSPDNRPQEGVRLVIVVGTIMKPDSVRPLIETTSDAEGRFEFHAPEDGAIQPSPLSSPANGEKALLLGLHSQTGFGWSEIPPLNSEDDPTEFNLSLQPLASISGQIYDLSNNQGLPGIPIACSFSPAGQQGTEAMIDFGIAPKIFPEFATSKIAYTTDKEGLYRFITPGDCVLKIQFDSTQTDYVVPGFSTRSVQLQYTLKEGEERLNVDFGLAPGSSVSGWLVDGDGNRVKNATVELLSSYATKIKRRLQSDAQGQFLFRGLASNATYLINAWVPKKSNGKSEVISIPSPQKIENLEVKLIEGIPFKGGFRDENGTPIPNLSMTLESEFVLQTTTSGIEAVKTGTDGLFSFPHVAPGEYLLRPYPQSHKSKTFNVIIEAESETTSDSFRWFELQTISEGFIAGTVIDEEGNPVRAQVTARRGGKLRGKVITNEQGQFHIKGLDHPSGYVIAAQNGTHYGPRHKNIDLYTSDLTLQVFRRGQIVGKVTDIKTGEPIERFEVRAAFTRPDGNKFHFKWITFENLEGDFKIERAEPDPVRAEVFIRAPGYLSQKIKDILVPPGEDTTPVQVRLEKGQALSGQIVDQKTKEPLEGVRVRAHKRPNFQPALIDMKHASWFGEDSWSPGMSNAEGEFDIWGVKTGESLHLVAWKDGYGITTLPNLKIDGRELKIELPQEALLEIQARVATNSQARYSIGLRHRLKPPFAQAYSTAQYLKKSRKLRFKQLPPGPYFLSVYSNSTQDNTSWQFLGTLDLDLVSGENPQMELQLDQFENNFSSIEGQVKTQLDPKSLAVEIRLVNNTTDRVPSRALSLDADGKFILKGLPEGKYRIQARTRERKPKLLGTTTVQVGNRRDEQVELKLKE